MSLPAEKEMYAPLASETSSTLETILAGERTRLVRFCAYLTGNPDAAEDLAQETVLEAWRNQQKLYHPITVRVKNKTAITCSIINNVRCGLIKFFYTWLL
jgi:DNA-directed RNA polymerase specialized sigma24 family protein